MTAPKDKAKKSGAPSKTKAAKEKTQVAHDPVTEWLEASSADDIADALMATSPAKAAKVALLVAREMPEQVERTMAALERAIEQDPEQIIGRMLGGALKGLFG